MHPMKAPNPSELDLAGNGSVQMTDEVRKWAALVGRWEFAANNARYLGGLKSKEPDQPPSLQEFPAPFGLAASGQMFRDGTVSFGLQLDRTERTTGGVALGLRSPTSPYVVAGIGGFEYAYSVVQFSPDRGFELIDQAGSLRNLPPKAVHQVQVNLDGQVIRMKVDSVPVLETVLRTPLQGAGFGLFAYDAVDVKFSDVCMRKERPRVFVMMPFRKEFDALYEDVIEPEAQGLGFDVIRVDKIAGPGIILEDIRRQIERSHVVIAEISTNNPNVFYELGYAHALNKPAVLLALHEPGREIPFDIRPYRAIFYDDSIGGKKQVQAELRSHLSASLQSE